MSITSSLLLPLFILFLFIYEALGAAEELGAAVAPEAAGTPGIGGS